MLCDLLQHEKIKSIQISLFLDDAFTKKQSVFYNSTATKVATFLHARRMSATFASRKKNPPTILVPVRPAFDGDAVRRLLSGGASPSLGFVAACVARAGSWLGLVDAADVVDASSRGVMDLMVVSAMGGLPRTASTHYFLAKRSSDEMMASDSVPSNAMELGALTKVPRRDANTTGTCSGALMCMDQPGDAAGSDLQTQMHVETLPDAVDVMQKWLGCVCVA